MSPVVWIEAWPSSFWTAFRLPVASSTRWPAVWRLVCSFSPLVVSGATMSWEVVFEVVPERAVGEGQLAHLLALCEDRQALALVVEVLELDGLRNTRLLRQEPEGVS
jgi:hypothetical protein